MARDDINSMRNMAIAYQQGKGVKKDSDKANDLLERANLACQPPAPSDFGNLTPHHDSTKKIKKPPVFHPPKNTGPQHKPILLRCKFGYESDGTCKAPIDPFGGNKNGTGTGGGDTGGGNTGGGGNYKP